MSQQESNQDLAEADATPSSKQPLQTAGGLNTVSKKPSMDFEKVKAADEQKMKDNIIHSGKFILTINWFNDHFRRRNWRHHDGLHISYKGQVDYNRGDGPSDGLSQEGVHVRSELEHETGWADLTHQRTEGWHQ